MIKKMNKPLFVVVDGPDLMGKTTLVNHIVQRLHQWSDLPVVRMRALGQGPIGNACRDRHLSSKTAPGFESLMLPMSIVEAYNDYVIPMLNDGGHVIMDRWIGSYFAYQVTGRKDKHAEVIYNNLFKKESIMPRWPDLYIVGDVSIDVAMDRLKQRGGEVNYLDEESRTFKEAVQSGFLTFQLENEHRTTLLDCNRRLDLVQQDTDKLLFDLITPP